MDHPLISDSQSDLRRRVIQLISKGYNVSRSSHIVFVCGGNDAHHMRQMFRIFCEGKKLPYDIFFPEFAMKDYFSGQVTEQFDIADFEQLVGKISHAIVVFPEAPGSFAETGYFSMIEELSKKIILVLDSAYQNRDSFISMGPARKIGRISLFEPDIMMSFNQPDFSVVVDRLARVSQSKTKRLMITDYSINEKEYDAFCLIFKLLTYCR